MRTNLQIMLAQMVNGTLKIDSIESATYEDLTTARNQINAQLDELDKQAERFN